MEQKFKLEIVQYAQKHGNRAVGRKFEMNLRQWLGGKEILERISKKKWALCSKK
jgi:hypothetical protein